MSQSRLTSELKPVESLTVADARTLYELFSQHYDEVDPERFGKDIEEKDYVILLREAASGEIKGFSTQKVLRQNIDGVPVRALYSGDTIIDPEYWGEQELVRSWCQFAGRVHAAEITTRLYWFLITKGYRTYLYLPVFYHNYYPRHDAPTPAFDAAVLDALARRKFPGAYRPESGLIVFPRSLGHLKRDLAGIPAGRRDDPRVNFFLEKNPGYAEGHELACLTEIRADNMKSIALRSYMEGQRLGPITKERPEPAGELSFA